MRSLAFAALAVNVATVLSSSINVLGPVGTLNIVNKKIAPDGFSRDAVLAGTTPLTPTFPGPLIKAVKGDQIRMNVVDLLTNHTMLKSTSIHWHGIFQKHTNWADGPSFVTQCPITSGHAFEYAFSVAQQSGTFWYHSHLHTQYCDGLRGPLVVYDRPDRLLGSLYDVDDESTIITLSDWYHIAARNIVGRAIPDSTLINGLGRWNGNNTGTTTGQLAVISVQKGRRYRFRLISLSCDPNYIFAIEGHNFTIIEADGVDVRPVEGVNSVQIFAAQRYSFVLHADQPKDNYWIRAQPDHASDTSFNNGINSAILRYVGAPKKDPIEKPLGPGKQLDTADLHPAESPAAPGGPALGDADMVIPLKLGFDRTTGQFLMNDVSYPANQTIPVLLQILSGGRNAEDLLPKGSVYTLPPNKTIELVLIGGDAVGGPHPFHLHGQDFSVVQDQGSTPNFKDPVRRDVVPVSAGLNTTIRFRTDNAGPWFLHCHIDFHLEAGLAVVMAVDTEHTKAQNPVPPSWNKLCPLYDALPDSQT